MPSNIYEEKDDYIIGYTYKYKNKFYFDKEDYNLISKYYWKIRSDKTVVTLINNKEKSMHSLIMGDGVWIHKNRMNNDNRKENLVPIKGYHNNGKVCLNGYISIYKPEHKRSFDNGCVYEHILIAEKMLNRELLKEECVHHKDRNRMNNSENNLMVFATNSDHILYHAGAEAILQENGAYKCNNNKYYIKNNESIKNIINDFKNKNDIIFIKNKSKYNLCPICNKNIKTISSSMCLECLNKEKSKNIPTKEDLEKLIYNIPFTKIGEMYNVTGNAVKKWCKKYKLPFRKKDINKIK